MRRFVLVLLSSTTLLAFGHDAPRNVTSSRIISTGRSRRSNPTPNPSPSGKTLTRTTLDPPPAGISLTDLAVWRSGSGVWVGTNSGAVSDPAVTIAKQWGNASLGDKALVGDMDGDGITDLVLWRDSTASFYWLTSSSGYSYPGASQQLGQSGDRPFVADIDGDGKADLIVWRPSNGTWYWLLSSNGYSGTPSSQPWGVSTDIPLTGDIDGDGKNDLIVYRPSTGVWFWRTSSSSYTSSFSTQWGGVAGDIPLTGDFDGDHKSDLLICRPGATTWYWLKSSSNFTAWSSAAWSSQATTDVPFVGDVDGDGLSDLMFWRPSTATWNWLTSGSGYLVTFAQSKQVGVATDTPLPPSIRLLRLQTPTISPADGVYTDPISVTISTTPAAGIVFTTDGTDPTVSSTQYTQPFSLSTTTEVRARASLDGYALSNPTAADYSWNVTALPPPTVAPASGAYSPNVTVTLTAPAGETIRYTLDGTTPTAVSPAYSGPFSVNASATVNARAWAPGYAPSTAATASYTIPVAAPTFSLPAGSYQPGQLITVTTATPGAVITYTLNGADPLQSDSTLPSGGTLVIGNYTLKAKAWKSSAVSSAVTTAAYVLTGQVGIFGGPVHTVALRSDGTTWAWGDNTHGALGDGTNVSHSSPVQITALTNAQSVSTGYYHTVAIMPDATVKSWGINVSGEVGDGTNTDRWSPVSVPGLNNVVAVDAGVSFTLALRADGTVRSWGYNGLGQLGDGTTTNRSSAVAVPNLTGVIAVAAGLDHSVALKSDGTVWTWGGNARGQLGNGSTTSELAPVQVSGLSGVVAIDAGYWSSLAIKADGTVWRWGSNSYGEIGDGTTSDRNVPVQMVGITNAAKAAARYQFTVVLETDGAVWTTGDNSEGQLGTPGPDRSIAAQVTGLPLISDLGVADVDAYPLLSDGSAWAWGRNGWGNIGDGTNIVRQAPVQIAGPGMAWMAAAPTLSVPAGTYSATQNVVVSNPQTGVDMHYTVSGADPTQADPTVASGASITVDATETLKVAAWKTGFIKSTTAIAAYTLIPATPTFSPSPGTFNAPQTVTISTTTTQTRIYYTVDGTTPTTSSPLYTSPVPIGTSTVLQAVAFRSGWTASATASGTFTMNFGTLPTPTISPAAGTYTGSATVTLGTIAGATLHYTLDGSDPTTSSTMYTAPFSVTTSSTLKVKGWDPDYSPSAIASAGYTIVVATPTLSPGSGTYPAGQVITVATATPGATMTYTLSGVDPLQTDAAVPASGRLIAGNYILKVKAWKTGAMASGVASGTYAVTGDFVSPTVAGAVFAGFGLRNDGTMWGWGRNDNSSVGDGTATPAYYPEPLGGLTGVRSIGAGYYRNLALLADGSVAGWGLNSSGEIGDGTTTTRPIPTAVAGLTDAVSLASGTSHAIAIRSNGTVVTWGYNGSGQLGDGTQTNRTSPVPVAGLTGVTAVAAGTDQTLALTSDGTVWSWGDNAQGQLGDGTTTRRLAPVQVSGLTNVVFVAAGNGTSMAIKNDGTVWMWGWNFYGQLGDGTGTNRLTPVQMAGITGAVAGGVGWEYSMVVLNDGTVWTTGRNSEGQLGTPNGDRSTVAQVTGMPPIARISVGAVTGFAVSADGSAWAWGRNAYENIGDGTSISRPSPVQIAGPGLVWRPWIPTIGSAGGQYTIEQNPLITNADPTAVMHYSTTGIDPTEGDLVVSAGATIPVTQSLTLKVRSFKAGAPPSEIAVATYTLKVANPAFSPVAGSYGSPQTVTLSTSTSGTTIRYTADGSAPTVYSPTYNTPLNIGSSTVVSMYASRPGWTSSDSVTGTFWIAPAATLVAPTITPPAGTYPFERVVTITPAESGASVRYTIDGSDPTAWSQLYTRAFGISETITIKARTFKAGFAPGPVATSTFTFAQPSLSGAPSVFPVGGRYTTQRVVTVTGPPGATLHYTTSGVDPTGADPTITSGGTITIDKSEVLKVSAWQSGLAPSVVRREDYLITGAVAAGEAFSMALKSDGTVWTWGDNSLAQLGDGGTAGRTAPFQVMTGGTAIAAGFHHALVLKADGTVWAWGENYIGEVGDGTTTMRRSPVQVSGLTNVVAIAASFYNSYAIEADGTLWAWGYNGWGQIGDGTYTDRHSPVQVPNLTGVQAIAAGESFALAVVSNGASTGAVWSWGYNSVGQLGDGTANYHPTPRPVSGAASVKSVFAGRAFSMAQTANDEILMWGSNDNGQQGVAPRADGFNNTNNYVPVRTGPWIGPVAQIGGGYYYALALGRDGRFWGWGDDCESELAYVPCDFRLSVEQISQFSSAAFFVGGGFHVLAVAQDGQVWSWGKNVQGQVGDGTLTTRSVPAPIAGMQLADNSFLMGDQDGDGIPTWLEYRIGTDPLSADTNGLGIPDSVNTIPNLDPDGDGLSNAMEKLLGTDPFNPDTDGDGCWDGVDAFPLDPTRCTVPPPDPNDHTPPVIILIYPTNARPVGGGL